MSYVISILLIILFSLMTVVFNLVAPIMVQTWKLNSNTITLDKILMLTVVMVIF